MIFEHIDRFVYSEYSAQLFLKWTSQLLEKDINILCHYANPESKFIQQIKEKTDALAITFNHSLLKGNEELKKSSKDYYRIKESEKDKLLFLNKFNILNNSWV